MDIASRASRLSRSFSRGEVAALLNLDIGDLAQYLQGRADLEEPAAAGSAGEPGDRVRLLHVGEFDAETFSFPVELEDPQPNGATVPGDWEVTDGGLSLPAGSYWITATFACTPTEAGLVMLDINFEEEWNAAASWSVSASEQNDGQAQPTTLRPVGIVSTATRDVLRAFAGSSATHDAENVALDLRVTRVA